jgi:hypothetical protein
MGTDRRTMVLLGVLLGALVTLGYWGLRASLGDLNPAVDTSELPTIRIEIDEEDLELLRRAIVEGDPTLGRKPGGNKPFVDGTYVDDDGVRYASKIGYRGLGQWHHHQEKPSLRIKIRKGALKSGHRHIELQRPEGALAMRNWLPDRLGRDLGLLSTQLEHVRVSINGVFKGVYVRNIRPGSSVLMAADRIPGTFFKGDNFTGALWKDAQEWKQRGETPEAIELFNRALAAIRQPTYSAALERFGSFLDMPALVAGEGPISARGLDHFESFLDMDVYTRWAALMVISGSVHADLFHNHLLHVAPERGKVEVVPWDVAGYGAQATPDLPVEVIRHPFAAVLSHDPRWVHRRNILLHELLQGPLSAESQIELAREELARVLPDLRADPHLASLEKLGIRRPGLAGGYGLVRESSETLVETQRELERWIQARASYVVAHLADARVAVRPDERRPGSSRVWVFGNVAVAVRHGADSNPTILYPGLTEAQKLFEMRPYRFPVMVYAPSPAPLVYDVEGRPESLSFTNAVTGEPVVPRNEVPDSGGGVRSIHPRAFEALGEPSGTVVLGPGTVSLTKSLHVGAGQELVIRPGSRLLMGAGVSIFSWGRVTVEGTAAAPVSIEAADSHRPWGTFGVIGPGTRGSHFSHMMIRGGGAGTDGRVHFKGMFNIYETEGAVIEDCEFGPNAHGDDAVNLASSRFIVRDSTWDGALSDGLDVDLSHGVIDGSRFANSGNDGLDVMGGAVLIRDSTLVGNGDKGMSIGEQAAVLGQRLRITRNHIGVEVKDDSRVLLSASELSENQTGWHGYRKKRFYRSAGRGLLVDSNVTKSAVADVVLDPLSELQRESIESIPASWSSWAANLEEMLTARFNDRGPRGQGRQALCCR